MARDHDPFDDVDWTTFGRTIGGRIRALDDDDPDPEIARRWKEAGKRKRKPEPRWRWITLVAILIVEVCVMFGVFVLLAQHSH
jgi:hypothetical protein